jgi:superfamily II DNA or RNA helicase
VYSRVIDNTHLWVRKSELRENTGMSLGQLKKQFTVRSKFDSDLRIPCYAEREKWFGFPRHYSSGKLPAEDYRDRRADGESFVFLMKNPLKDGQQKILDDFKFRELYGETGFLIDAPTGSGKTFIASKILEHMKRSVLVVVSKSDLIDEWLKEIKKHTNIHSRDIGIGADGKIKWEGKKLVVALVHTLAKDREGDDFKKNFGIVIYDEIHRSVPPETFSTVADMFPSRYRIGLSATLERRDGLHRVFNFHIGGAVLKGKGAKKLNSTIAIINYKAPKGTVPKQLPVITRRGIILKMLERDWARSHMICRYIKKFYNSEGRRCVVLSDRTRQLKEIREILIEEFHVTQEDIGYYTKSVYVETKKHQDKNNALITEHVTRPISQKERDRSRKECRIILATYKMMDTGTNILDLSGLILATPQTTAIQAMGRIERFMEGKKQPIVIDVVDTRFRDTKIWAEERMKEYKKRKLVVKELN